MHSVTFNQKVHELKVYTHYSSALPKVSKHFVYMEGELEFHDKNSAVNHSMCECKSKFLGYLIKYVNYRSRYIFLQLRSKLKR